jgi:hypothetical protein
MKNVHLYRFFASLGAVLLLSGTAVLAQISTSSPYSRYGIGDVTGKGFVQNFSMGGACIGVQNDTLAIPTVFINSGNPASYANTQLTSIELGAVYNRVILQNETDRKTVHSAAINYLALAFPITKWWGTTVGLTPYSAVGYNVSDHQEIPNIGGVDFLYEGKGGVDQLYWGNGFKPLYGLSGRFVKSKKYALLLQEKKFTELRRIYKRRNAWKGLSMGVNASYMFGSFENTRRSIFDPAGSFFNTRTGTTTRFSDIYFDYGTQYSFIIDSLRGRDLTENVRVTFGATFAAETDISARVDSLSVNYFYGSLGNEIVRDTISMSQNTEGSITFPLTFGFGASIKKGTRWMFAADYAVQNWSNYKAFDKSPGLKNSSRISIGAQFVPKNKGIGSNYFTRVNYRMGLRYATTALELKSTRLNEYGVSAGLGFPVGRGFSMFNVGAELGTRGTIQNGLIKENYLKIIVGFTMNDRWFQKAKID